ncbi:hypothetical protein C7377_0904 [Balneicella halophila]|uniref:Uncharacterized protein n=1 Tax=Balneicella halophila TaxID=1537566 RepID=A0A7L4UTA7_BALHA|nr:hypothetical protein [Balneicella halophila]PVX52577.1 hypothetical protein C7377_0904 [Balneicella halophila]
MKKSLFFKIVMLLTVVVLTVNCKDYDDDIDSLQNQINALKSDLSADFEAKMDAKISTLQAEIDALQSDMANAATAEDIEAAKQEIMDKVVTLEMFNEFKDDVMAQLEAATNTDELDAVVTDVNSLEGRVAALEALLKIKEDGTFDGLQELEDNIAANEASIKALIDGGIDEDKFNELLEEMGLNISELGQGLTSLVYYPETYVNGVEAIVFRPVVFRAETTDNWQNDECNPSEPPAPGCLDNIGTSVSMAGAENQTFTMQLLSAATTVAYNVNASNIDVSKLDTENLMVTSHVAKMYTNSNVSIYTKAGGAEDAVENNPFTAKFVDMMDGKMHVSLDIDYTAFENAYGNDFNLEDYFTGVVGNGSESENGDKNIVLALQVPAGETATGTSSYVTSDYTLATVQPIYGIDIAKPNNNDCLRYSDYIDGPSTDDQTQNVPGGYDFDWAGVENAKYLGDGINLYDDASNLKPKDARIVDLVEGETLDLHTVVKAIGGSERFPDSKDDCVDVDVEKYGFEWEFSLLDGNDDPIEYILENNNTDQQQFITLNEETGEVKARVFSQDPNGAAVDRTPIVRVRLIDPENPTCFISQAFIKILIGEEEEERPDDVIIGLEQAEYVVGCNEEDTFTQMFTVQQVNEQIYNELGLSKQRFHEKYPEFEHVNGLGTVEVIEDTEDGQTTYLPKWTVNACAMYAEFVDKCGENSESAILTATGRYFNDAGEQVIVKFSVLAKLADNMNLEPADLYAKYWHENFTYIEHHSQKPRSVNDSDVNNFTYTTDINGAFVNQNTTPSAFDNMEYEYIFAPATEQISGAKYRDGSDIIITIENDGKELRANGELVATITDHEALNAGSGTFDPLDPQSSDFLTYEKNDMANYLLNKANNGENYFMWARLQIKAQCTCPDAPETFVKINGNDGFNVRFLRPIDVNSTSTEKFIDGVDQGKFGSIVDIFKAVGLADWRKDTFAENDNYYDFYGVTSITYEEGARWDASGSIEPIPTTVELSWIDRATVASITNGDLNFDGQVVTDTSAANSDEDPDLFRYGGLRYDSNESVVTEDYYLYIPITIIYDRGTIVTREIKILVEATTTN